MQLIVSISQNSIPKKTSNTTKGVNGDGSVSSVGRFSVTTRFSGLSERTVPIDTKRTVPIDTLPRKRSIGNTDAKFLF